MFALFRHLALTLTFGAVCVWCASTAQATTQTFVVTSAANPGSLQPGTLTWAIYQANYGGADLNYIRFNIPGVISETEIVLGETLYIARPMVIDATTQLGYAGQPLIRINANKLDSAFCIVPAGNGLPGGGGSTIKGLRIYNYNSNGITIFKGADSNLIAHNLIGFLRHADGSYFKNTSVMPTCRGIGLQSSSNRITGNTISGVDNAIVLAGDPTFTCKNNTIDHNFIGTDPTGLAVIGNTSDGVFLTTGAQNNLIGPGNVLSGMTSSGVELLDATASGNRIFGNMIGVNATGTAALGNGELGVLIASGAANNWVGGPYGGNYAGNIISSNTLGAVAIGTSEFPGVSGTNDNHVEGNLIGCDATETRVLGTQGIGVTVQFQAHGNIVRKNVIVGETMHGVSLADANNNALYGNWIGVNDKGVVMANAGFGVYLADSSYNAIQLSVSNASAGTEQNIFGANLVDTVGVYGNSVGNIIDLTQTNTRLLNISTRMQVEGDNNALIGGFIITGSSAKKVLVRGLGTSLRVAGALADPTLQLDGNGVSLSNDDWKATQAAEITATGIPPTSDLESAIVTTLPPGGYTAILRGKNNSRGVGLVEVYDLDSSGAASLANISTRGVVQTGDNVMIAGFILGAGQTQPRLGVRALGPSLAASGVTNALSDPTLQLLNANGTVINVNDNWQTDASQASQLTSWNIAPSDPAESGIIATLPPGNYTAVVAGKNGATGTALVEVYNLQ